MSVRGASKAFRLPHEHVHTLKERVLHPFRRRSFDRLQALDDVAFDVRRGEFFGIVGRNGSGKSTLMKCLAGIYRLDDGEMWVRGRLAPFIELGVGFNPDMTARENVVLNAIMLGLTPAEARERYPAIIEFAELEQFVDLKLKNYSSGMHVRLAFAVMVHAQADVLLIDEVLAVGDAAFQRKCQDALTSARDEGRTILLVTHDMNAVQRFCDRALLLERGRLMELGDPRLVARRYEEVNLQHGEAERSAGLVGDGTAALVDTWFEDRTGQRVDVLEHGEPCGIGMRVAFRAFAEDPVFGVVLSDHEHRTVFAATSEWTHARSGRFEAGDEVEVVVRFECLLASGRYFASPEVGRPGRSRRLMDHRLDAATVTVQGSRQGAGVVDLPHEVSIAAVGAAVERSAGL